MGRFRGLVIGFFVLATLGPGVAVASAAPRASVTNLFSSGVPGASVGRTYAVDFTNPSDPAAKPPAVSHVHMELPEGARFDTTAIPQCTASDVELIAMGEAACPAGSALGTNAVVIDTGVPGLTRFAESDFLIFNNQDELVLLAHLGDTRLIVLRGTVGPQSLDIDVPLLPGTPPDGGADRSERATFSAATGSVGGRPAGYLTTPPNCPPSGEWVTQFTYDFRDGVSEAVDAGSPCTGDSGGSGAPATGGVGGATAGATTSTVTIRRPLGRKKKRGKRHRHRRHRKHRN